MNAIQAQGIIKFFGSQRVLNQVDLVVPVGKFVAIIGPGGCGKSTLLKIITRLLLPDQGRILVFEQDIGRLHHARLSQCRRRMGIVFQQSPLLDQRDIAGNLRLNFEYASVTASAINQRIAEALAMVNLIGYEHKMPGQLSGGERKRAAIACAIVRRPDLMLYDEPTLSLDPHNKNLVVRLMNDLHHSAPHAYSAEGFGKARVATNTGQITSLVVSHDLDILSLADSVLFLQDGRLHHLGKGQDLAPKYLRRLFAESTLPAGKNGPETRKEAT